MLYTAFLGVYRKKIHLMFVSHDGPKNDPPSWKKRPCRPDQGVCVSAAAATDGVDFVFGIDPKTWKVTGERVPIRLP